MTMDFAESAPMADPHTKPRLPTSVAPDGTLFATPARGLFMGNRGGRFHDAVTRKTGQRQHVTRQWICCVTSFRGRQRQVWGPSTYTELFFCDEVTALSAGHRPCMECRRSDALAFRQAAADGLGLAAMPGCPGLDRLLDGERRSGRAKRLHRLEAASLPDGTMIRTHDGRFHAIKGKTALLWSPAGYVAEEPRPKGPVDVLTPPTILAALKAGYQPLWSLTCPGG